MFGKAIDILTCDVERDCVIAFAYEMHSNGEHLKTMQTYAVDVVKALKELHDISCKRLAECLADCNHELRPEHLAKCQIVVPMQIQSLSECENPALSEGGIVLIDIPNPEEEPDSSEAKHGPTPVQEGMERALSEFEQIQLS